VLIGSWGIPMLRLLSREIVSLFASCHTTLDFRMFLVRPFASAIQNPVT
jgi:hypothetical protein